MSGLTTVYKKEVRENLRDRRSLFNSVLLGPILFPILFIGLAYFAGSKQQERAEEALKDRTGAIEVAEAQAELARAAAQLKAIEKLRKLKRG